MMQKILIIDDHQIFLEGITLLFSSHFDCRSVTSLEQAKNLLQDNNNYDLILVDLNMGVESGLILLDYLKEMELWIPTAIISGSDFPADIIQVINMGASGYISKTNDFSTILQAVTRILSGEVYTPHQLQDEIQHYQKFCARLVKDYGVGPRQLAVLKLLGEGFSNKEIGNQLFVSEATIKSHVSLLMKALGAKNRVECIKNAQSSGLIRL